MKCLGLLGGENFEATAAYGRRIAEEIQHRFGHGQTCRLLTMAIHSPELTQTLDKQSPGIAPAILKAGADALVKMGAEAIVPCSSRLQGAAGRLALDVPLLAMHDAVGAALQTLKVRRVGLVGAFTEVEEVQWRKQLARYHVLDTFVPVHRDREHLAHLATLDLHQGIVNQTTRADVGRIMYSLRQAGARTIILAAPELGLALSHLDPVLPVLDAVELHALAALEWSLKTAASDPSIS